MVLLIAVALMVTVDGDTAPPSDEAGGRAPAALPVTEAREILMLFYSGQHDAVIRKTSEFFTRYPLSKDTFPVLLVQAESRYALGDRSNAIAAFQRALPFIESLNNVVQRRYAWVFFRLGALHHRSGQSAVAIGFIESGLTREPQNIYFQIMLGELFAERGERERARIHFTELLASAVPNSEERLVLRIKIDRLTNAAPPAPPVDMTSQPLYAGLRFGIVPINQPERIVSLRDVCLFLESKWLVGCDVLAPITLAEDGLLDRERRQYDGERVLAELVKRYPMNTRTHRFILGVTKVDLFGTDTNFVFSWQDLREGVGVISTYRFLTGLDDFYERPTVATRRMAIQALSTSSALLGFTRPTKAHCPSAYPHDFGEFLQKGSRLCDSEIEQRDGMLKRTGGKASPFGVQKAAEIDRVYRTYHFE